MCVYVRIYACICILLCYTINVIHLSLVSWKVANANCWKFSLVNRVILSIDCLTNTHNARWYTLSLAIKPIIVKLPNGITAKYTT